MEAKQRRIFGGDMFSDCNCGNISLEKCYSWSVKLVKPTFRIINFINLCVKGYNIYTAFLTFLVRLEFCEQAEVKNRKSMTILSQYISTNILLDSVNFFQRIFFFILRCLNIKPWDVARKYRLYYLIHRGALWSAVYYVMQCCIECSFSWRPNILSWMTSL